MNSYELARSKVGTSALRMLNDYGIETAGIFFQGAFAALTVCLLSIYGRDRTLELFTEIVGSIPPQERTRPHLVVNNIVPDFSENIVA